MTDIIDQPIKFLGATVLSFNCQLGLGASESTINVDLIEDCEDNPPDLFLPKNNSILVGAPVYFQAGAFSFGGVLQNWTYSQSGSGRTFNVRVSDPRQLLENTVVITDSYLGSPTQGINYFNVYAYWEGEILDGNCEAFGESWGGERGMPYAKVISALTNMNPIIYSPTGYSFTINFGSFPSDLPEYYRISGPSISILQLLQDVCDVMGFEFFVELLPGNIINIGLINLRNPPVAFDQIITSYNGIATDLSYGQELRNEVTKTVLFGEQQHYLSRVDKFNYFFGEDFINGTYVPIVPWRYDECGFWISKKIDSLNLSLKRPLPTNGPYNIHELDIRGAMVSQELWLERVMSNDIKGTFNEAVRLNWPEARTDGKAVVGLFANAGAALAASPNANFNIADAPANPRPARAAANKPEFLEDLEKVWNFIKNLGDTFYGKQFITPLNQLICFHQDPNAAMGEKKFSDIPTNAGGWVDDGIPVLGLLDPELGLFREEDGRIGCFALFNFNGERPNEEATTKSSFDGFRGDISTPSPGNTIGGGGESIA